MVPLIVGPFYTNLLHLGPEKILVGKPARLAINPQDVLCPTRCVPLRLVLPILSAIKPIYLID
jgi:hypothetical protein